MVGEEEAAGDYISFFSATESEDLISQGSITVLHLLLLIIARLPPQFDLEDFTRNWQLRKDAPSCLSAEGLSSHVPLAHRLPGLRLDWKGPCYCDLDVLCLSVAFQFCVYFPK